MAGFIDNILFRFKRGDLLIKLIFINIAVFLILAVLNLVSTLFKLPFLDLNPYISVSSNFYEILKQPWTLFTYMFVHYDIFHILFNMIILYSFGKIFLSYFSIKNLGALYILGGLAGALLYAVAFNTIPYYLDFPPTTMVGASAAVSAIIFATAGYRPNLEINIFFFRVKIIYIAAFIFVLDCLYMGSDVNPGGHVAHIGGAIFGYLFALQYSKGKDLTKGLNKLLDSIANMFKPRPSKLKVKYKAKETDREYNQRKHNNNAEVDKILDKIKESGYTSLTKDEKQRLFDASNK